MKIFHGNAKDETALLSKQPLKLLLLQGSLLGAKYPRRGPDMMTKMAIHLNDRNWRLVLHRHLFLMLLFPLNQSPNNKRQRKRDLDIMIAISAHINAKNDIIQPHLIQHLLTLLVSQLQMTRQPWDSDLRRRAINGEVKRERLLLRTHRAQGLRHPDPQSRGRREEMDQLHCGSWMIRARQSYNDP